MNHRFRNDSISQHEDAVEHVEHLPEITSRETFDKVDDSVFNDQNEAEPQ